jgi:hypothetical protein
MATVFDVVTVTCFVGLVIAFFQFSDRELKTLLFFSISGVVFAVANQLGNAGYNYFALALIVAAIGFAGLVLRR